MTINITWLHIIAISALQFIFIICLMRYRCESECRKQEKSDTSDTEEYGVTGFKRPKNIPACPPRLVPPDPWPGKPDDYDVHQGDALHRERERSERLYAAMPQTCRCNKCEEYRLLKCENDRNELILKTTNANANR